VFALIPSILWTSLYYDVHMVMNALRHGTSSMTSLHSLQRKLVYMWFMINYTLFLLPCFIHLDATLTLFLQGWGSNPCRHCYCWFHMCISFGMCIFYTWFCSIRGRPKNEDCHLGDHLLPLAIKVFDYSHIQLQTFYLWLVGEGCFVIFILEHDNSPYC